MNVTNWSRDPKAYNVQYVSYTIVKFGLSVAIRIAIFRLKKIVNVWNQKTAKEEGKKLTITTLCTNSLDFVRRRDESRRENERNVFDKVQKKYSVACGVLFRQLNWKYRNQTQNNSTRVKQFVSLSVCL